MQNPVIPPSLISWGVASRALAGQTVCGDLHVVKPRPEGVLLAAVDGLGHGDEAAVAARIATAILESDTAGSLVELFQRCHEALKQTRGAVMTAATVEPSSNRLTWLGVGNVEAVLLRAEANSNIQLRRALLRAGIVGYKLPELRVATTSVAPGDLLIFATDGIGPGFTEEVVHSDPPQQIADTILERHFKGSDDALVLAARYPGTRQ